MSIIELFFLGAALAMDAFAVSVCKGLATSKTGLREMATAGLWFGGFQAIMPCAGYFLGNTFKDYIEAVDHWIAFVLLTAIGLNMICEGFSKYQRGDKDALYGATVMFPLALSTSIDAFATGITLSLFAVNIAVAAVIIGGVTFILSAAGIKIGAVFGVIYKKKAQIAGGLILIIIGLRILFVHLGILSL